jgi:hypothetical protein
LIGIVSRREKLRAGDKRKRYMEVRFVIVQRKRDLTADTVDILINDRLRSLAVFPASLPVARRPPNQSFGKRKWDANCE